MNRRRFLTGALGAGAVTLGTPWLATAQGATEDDLAFANFGASTEYLVRDFYAKALAAKLVSGPTVAALKRGRAAAGRHAKALSDLLTNAGDVAPLPEDFEFEWPADTFTTEKAMVDTGRRGAARAPRRLPDRRCDGERSVATACSTRASRQVSASRSSRSPSRRLGRAVSRSRWTSRPRATRSRRIWVRRRDGKRIAALVIAIFAAAVLASGARTQTAAADHLRRGVADRRVPGVRRPSGTASPARTRSRRRSGTARPRTSSPPRRPLNTQRLFRQGSSTSRSRSPPTALALIVPKDNPADIHSVYDLKRKPA